MVFKITEHCTSNLFPEGDNGTISFTGLGLLGPVRGGSCFRSSEPASSSSNTNYRNKQMIIEGAIRRRLTLPSSTSFSSDLA